MLHCTIKTRATLVVALLVCSVPRLAAARDKDESAPARAVCARALAAGDLASLRVGWTMWESRQVSRTVEIQGVHLVRRGGAKTNARLERDLTADEQKQLLAALREARADKLLWINRDVKNEYDRVLNIDVLQPPGPSLPVGAFLRTRTTWNRGETRPLAELLERWLTQ